MMSDVTNVGLKERKLQKVSPVHHFLVTHEMTLLYSVLLVFSVFHYYPLPVWSFYSPIIYIQYICTELLQIAELFTFRADWCGGRSQFVSDHLQKWFG